MVNLHGSRWTSMSFFLVSWVLFVVAYGGAYWADDGEHHMGLWRRCSNRGGCFPNKNFETTSYMVGVQATMTLALIVYFFAFCTYCGWGAVPTARLASGPSGVGVAAVSLGLAAGILAVMGVSVFAVMYPKAGGELADLAWSWWVGIMAAVMTLLNGLLTLLVVTLCKPVIPPVVLKKQLRQSRARSSRHSARQHRDAGHSRPLAGTSRWSDTQSGLAYHARPGQPYLARPVYNKAGDSLYALPPYSPPRGDSFPLPVYSPGHVSSSASASATSPMPAPNTRPKPGTGKAVRSPQSRPPTYPGPRPAPPLDTTEEEFANIVNKIHAQADTKRRLASPASVSSIGDSSMEVKAKADHSATSSRGSGSTGTRSRNATQKSGTDNSHSLEINDVSIASNGRDSVGGLTSPNSDIYDRMTSSRNDLSGSSRITSPQNGFSGGSRMTSPRDDTSGGSRMTSPGDDISGGSRMTSPRDDISGGSRMTSPRDDISGGSRMTSPRDDLSGGSDEWVTSPVDDVISRRQDTQNAFNNSREERTRLIKHDYPTSSTIRQTGRPIDPENPAENAYGHEPNELLPPPIGKRPKFQVGARRYKQSMAARPTVVSPDSDVSASVTSAQYAQSRGITSPVSTTSSKNARVHFQDQ